MNIDNCKNDVEDTDIISFFGASVTAQKTGFAVCISKKMNNLRTYIHGYGSNHIHDAGICNIDIVLENKPTYCFIDFFSTGYCYMDRTLECLDTIVYKFTKSKCKLVFLFILRNDHTDRLNYYTDIKRYLNSKNLYYIDINDYLEFNSEIIRDTIHTTDVGSEKYAEIIYSMFEKDKSKIEYPKDNVIVKTKYCDIKVLNVNKTFKENIILEGEGIIIAVLLKIGPTSGIIEIYNKKYTIWDMWCHYERNSFNMRDITLKDKLEIKILQDDVDYSKCTREMKYDGLKELNIISIYYTGNILNIFEI